MGKCRCLSKPIKRFFFAYADKISEKWILIVSRKYTLKYINKLNKLNNLNNEFDSSHYHHNQGLIKYTNNLNAALNQEKSLAHSKVREYWLRRGPRLLIVLVLTILITIGLAELLINVTYEEHIYSILVGINMFLFSIYMLYQRLTDSISGIMMKIGHDHYNQWKNDLSSIQIQNTIHCVHV